MLEASLAKRKKLEMAQALHAAPNHSIEDIYQRPQNVLISKTIGAIPIKEKARRAAGE